MTKRNSLYPLGRRAAVLAIAATLALGLGLGMTACSDDDSSGDTCGANLLPGDLVITEVMADAEGADDGKEWFEVYNATTQPIDLSGVDLVYSRADGTGQRTHTIEAATIGAGEYMVFGGVLEVAMPAHVDYAYGDDLGSLTNSGARLGLRCNATLVDDIVYLEASEGVSLSFDGQIVPDAIANDTITDWCASESEYETGSFGTPGAANDSCGGGNTSTCLDNGVERDVIPPQAGDVVITEIMADPSAVGDGDGEWIEVYFAQAADLNGLVLGDSSTTSTTVSGVDCISVTAGSYVVFATNADSLTNGGLTNVAYELDFGLTNGGELLTVSHGTTPLDEITYTDAMISAGTAASLDSGVLTPAGNDDPGNWCDAVDAYGDGDLGTPGAANPSCGIVPPDTCIDPVSSNSRSIVVPAMGDVIITELMADPAAVTDANGEWVEVYFANDADLNGLQLGDTGNPTNTTVTSADCLPVTAGSYVVFAVNVDSLGNGGITNVAYEMGFGLTNGGESVHVGYGGTEYDAVSYTNAATGASTSLSATALDTTANDAAGAWCTGIASYGDGDLGTPGAANPTCP